MMERPDVDRMSVQSKYCRNAHSLTNDTFGGISQISKKCVNLRYTSMRNALIAQKVLLLSTNEAILISVSSLRLQRIDAQAAFTVNQAA